MSLARSVRPGVGINPKTSITTVSGVADGKDCDEYITPKCLRKLYGLFYKPVATDKNSYGIGEWMFPRMFLICAHVCFVGCFPVEYTPQAYLQSDLQMFAQNYSTDLIGKEPHSVSIDGGKHLFSGPTLVWVLISRS